MKILHKFIIAQKRKVNKTTKVEGGGTLTEEVEEDVPMTICIKSPNRRESEEADIEYSMRLSECIKKGILTKAMMSKKYSEFGGAWSEQEFEDYNRLTLEYSALSKEFDEARTAHAMHPNKTNEIRMKETYDAVWLIFNQLSNFEKHKSEIFNETAEAKAKLRQLAWYVCNLVYVEYDSPAESSQPIYENFFAGDTFEDKLNDYDEKIDKEDSWEMKVIEKSQTIISFWFNGGIDNEEDFQTLEKVLNPDNKSEEKPVKKKTVKKKAAKKV